MNDASDVLTAVYTGKLDEARALAATRMLDACEATALGDTDSLDAALVRDSDAHAMYSGDGWTPLHLAGFFGSDACAARLLASGASLTAISRNSTANTPLHAALAGATNDALVARLLDAGADANARGETGITPLHLAASRGNRELCEMLLSRGARLGAAMNDGTTPAKIADARGHTEVSTWLAELAELADCTPRPFTDN